MEVKIESSDQFIEKNYSEMCEKYGKLQQDYAELRQEMAEVRKENSKLKKEMAKNNEKYKKQIAILHKELTKLKGRDQGEDLESRQSQNYMMDPSRNNTFDHLPAAEEIAQNGEFAAKTMIMGFQMGQQQQPSQNLVNIIDSIGNASAKTIIKRKRKYENTEMQANCPFQMQTSTTFNTNDEFENYQNIRLEEDGEFVEGSVEMDLEDEEEMNDKSVNEKNHGIDGKIKFVPIQIGKMLLKCNWPRCEYQTKELTNMRMHWRVHNGEERPYVCAECGQSFGQSGALAVHKKRIHNDEMPYICGECGQSFASSRALRTHELIHKGEKKPHRCDECGKSFNQSYHLIAHKRIHTVEKPFVCTECGQSFKHSNSLKKHLLNLLIQCGEKPYQCDVCGKSFKLPGQLANHEQIHKKPHQCDVCGKSFGQIHYLIDHHKLVHSIERPNICSQQMNVDTSPENASTIIKLELENNEMGANSSFQFQMQTTSSTALNLNDEDGVQQKSTIWQMLR